MKIISKPTVHIENPYKDRVYTCPNCGVKFQVEDSDVKDVIVKPVTECFSQWYEHNINRNWILRFIPCECGHLVNLTKLVAIDYCWDIWDIEFNGEEIKKENNNEND